MEKSTPINQLSPTVSRLFRAFRSLPSDANLHIKGAAPDSATTFKCSVYICTMEGLTDLIHLNPKFRGLSGPTRVKKNTFNWRSPFSHWKSTYHLNCFFAFESFGVFVKILRLMVSWHSCFLFRLTQVSLLIISLKVFKLLEVTNSICRHHF